MQSSEPAKQPNQIHVHANGLRFRLHEWGQQYQGQRPSIVLVHATGFHGRCWDQVVAGLGRRHVIAMDQRGHGGSDSERFENWRAFGDDLAAVLAQLELTGAIGVGHSMGGHAAVTAASLDPSRFSQLMLVDPVIMDPSYYSLWDPKVLSGEPAHPAARRRFQFASAQDMVERYRARLPFSLFTDAAMADYCEYGVVDAGEGVELACAPDFEARIYDSAFSHGAILEHVKAVNVPVTVVRSMQPTKPDDIMDFRYSPTWQHLAQAFVQGRDLCLQELTHFMPMQDPAVVADLIREL